MSDHAETLASAISKLNEGDVDGYITTLYAPEAVFHGFPPDFSPDRAGITQFFRALVAGVSGLTVTAKDVLRDGDRVAVRFTVTGTHTGELFGLPPTGNPVDAEGITIMQFQGDKVVERWNRLDDMTFLTQVGAA